MMNKSAIDWCDFSWNPVTGCNFGCEYCYARRQATRFSGNTRLNMTNEQLKTETAGLYILEQPFKNYNGAVLPFPVGFAPTFHKYRLGDPAKKKKPANIFVCSMADLFGAETGHRAGKITPEEGWLEELAAAARRAGVPLWIKDSEEIRDVIGGEPAQALPDALKRPKDRPTPHCSECEHCVKTREGQRGTRKECAIGWTAEGYEDGGARHIPTRGNRQSPDWCPRRKDDAE